jgi:hypothetical protein
MVAYYPKGATVAEGPVGGSVENIGGRFLRHSANANGAGVPELLASSRQGSGEGALVPLSLRERDKG